AAADTMVERLQRARRRVILVGPSMMTRKGRESTAALENAAQVPVIGMESPRGLADSSLGAFAPMLAQADCVLLLGKRLDYTLKFGRAPVVRGDCEFLQIDPDPVEIDRARRALDARLSTSRCAEVFAAADSLVRQARAQS